MGIIGLDTSGSGIGIPETMRERALAANALLHSREGAGSDFLGWVHLPSSISDPELAAIQAYGVWQEKKNYGKVSMGVVRSTFIIDENGMVEKVMPKVKPDTNVGDVLAWLAK